MSDYLDPANEELLKDFFDEAQSQIEILERNILSLETDPHDRDAVDEVFRAAHTLKGGAATVEMFEISEFTHLLEDVLDEIRGGRLEIAEEVVTALLSSLDVAKAMLEARSSGTVFEDDTSDLRDVLKSYLTGDGMQPIPESAGGPGMSDEAQMVGAGVSEYELLEMKEAGDDVGEVYRVRVSFDEQYIMNSVGGIQVYSVLKGVGSIHKTDPELEKLYEDTFYPIVDYYISADLDAAKIEELCTIPDVTLKIEVAAIEVPSAGGEDEETHEEPKEEQESPAEKQVLPAKAQVSSAEKQVLSAEKQEPPAGAQRREDLPEEKADERREPSTAKRVGGGGSLLRVASRRIDDLLNLVSEAVINKATFNQLGSRFGESLTEFEMAQSRGREELRELFETMPSYLEELGEGKSLKAIRKDMMERFSRLFSQYDRFESELKTTVDKFLGTSQNLARITGELQEGVMGIRMVPISQIFSRFPRLIRNLTKSLNKSARLEIQGEETELDKSVIEDLLDPLMHCVRNSIDHGIEQPEERVAVGKPQEGTIRLKAHNEGNMIVIEVSDDGKGIDLEAVRTKATQRGLIHPDKTLTSLEAFNLIFEPGFSTAKQVTDISGRGVGLDVVKRQVEKLNGSVSVWSELGKGSTFTIKLPLTLAILQGLLVRVGKEIYAIPITSVLESHRVRPSEIRLIDSYEVINVREDVLSLLRLNRLFGIDTEEQKSHSYVVIVGTGEKKVGLMVDSLIGEEDVVIKPLKDRFTTSPGIAGATILGDGTVSLILDVGQLLEYGLRTEIVARRKREDRIRTRVS